MSDNAKAREIFEADDSLEIIGSSVNEDCLTLQINGGFPDGRYAVQIRAVIGENDACEQVPRLEFDFDEPRGAGDDPYGRPDPRTHPEAWTE